MVSDMAFQPNLGDLNTYRLFATANGAALSTGVMTSVSMPLKAGQKVTSISVVSATTAAGTPTHWWFALYSAAATPAKVAQTADQTTTALAANTLVTKALAAPVTIAVAGIYWIGIMWAATTPPTLLSAPAQTAGLLNNPGILTGEKGLAVTSGTGLTTTAPATIATPAASLVVPLVFVS
jgi:hypothetical protein